MKRLVMMVLVLVAVGGTTEVSAQSWLDQLGKKVKEKAKDKVEQKILQKTDQVIEKAFDKTEDAVKGNGGNQTGVPQEAAPQQPVQQTPAVQEVPAEVTPEPVSVEAAYAKSDFVPGDEIFFEDDVTREQLGEFPSQWDLIHGSVEIAQLNGINVIQSVSLDDPIIAPLFDDMRNYLPEKFTLEFDYWVGPYAGKNETGEPSNQYHIEFYKPNSSSRCQYFDISDWYGDGGKDRSSRCAWTYTPVGGGDTRNGDDGTFKNIPNSWNHVAISFNKRAMKLYINGIRYANIPNTEQPGHFRIEFYRSGGYYQNKSSIKNIRIAKGAVPLYDRMMSDGKFITYGITFDVGKATIKPESMGEINRIVQLMTENPDLKFSVEGHTDSTGNAASNQTLSEQRSQAIVAKLVELGIAQDRLTAVGKGQNSPIADNNTDEGRAKNRRVEFVKM